MYVVLCVLMFFWTLTNPDFRPKFRPVKQKLKNPKLTFKIDFVLFLKLNLKEKNFYKTKNRLTKKPIIIFDKTIRSSFIVECTVL